MFSFEYTYDDYADLLQALAIKANVPIRQQSIEFPPHIAFGFFRIYQYPGLFQVSVIDCVLNDDWLVYRHKDRKEYYSLRFDQLKYPDRMEVNIGGDLAQKAQDHEIALSYLTSSLFDWYYRGPRGAHYKAVNVLLEKEFIAGLLGEGNFEKILPAYIALRTRSMDIQPMTVTCRQKADAIINEATHNVFPKLFVYNRVRQMVELFFSDLLSRADISEFKGDFKRSDIREIMQIEKMLVRDFTEKPPTINQLARHAAMSSTKLKRLFRQVFNTPLYEYYQQRRMQRAAELLATGKYSVNEVGKRIGYQNISNFSLAFKKHFSMTPMEFQQSSRDKAA